MPKAKIKTNKLTKIQIFHNDGVPYKILITPNTGDKKITYYPEEPSKLDLSKLVDWAFNFVSFGIDQGEYRASLHHTIHEAYSNGYRAAKREALINKKRKKKK